jgi:HPt (histidine-containing phosphotransfer) domain-containing protein
MKDLQKVMGKYLQSRTVACALVARQVEPVEIPVLHVKSMLDQGRLDMIRALQRPNRPNVLKKIIDLYQQSSPAHLRTILDAVSSGNNIALQEASHSLKTASANLGALELAAICKELEDLGRDEKSEEAKGLLDNLGHSFQETLDALITEMERISDDQ